MFESRNPSGVRVTTDAEGVGIISDPFEQSAIVFGIFEDGSDEIAGGLRLLRPHAGVLELELHRQLPPRFRHSYLRKFEVNRVVMRQGVDGPQALVLLLQALGTHLRSEECDVVLFAAAEPEPAGFLRRIGFSTTEPGLWRYGPKETPPVRLLHLDCRVSGALSSLIYLSLDSGAKAA